MKVFDFDGGRVFTAENETDERILLKFSERLKEWSHYPTSRNKKRAKQLWKLMERLLGHELEMSAGIARNEIF